MGPTIEAVCGARGSSQPPVIDNIFELRSRSQGGDRYNERNTRICDRGEIAEVGPPPTTVVEAAATVVTADPDSPGARYRLPIESTIHRRKSGSCLLLCVVMGLKSASKSQISFAITLSTRRRSFVVCRLSLLLISTLLVRTFYSRLNLQYVRVRGETLHLQVVK